MRQFQSLRKCKLHQATATPLLVCDDEPVGLDGTARNGGFYERRHPLEDRACWIFMAHKMHSVSDDFGGAAAHMRWPVWSPQGTSGCSSTGINEKIHLECTRGLWGISSCNVRWFEPPRRHVMPSCPGFRQRVALFVYTCAPPPPPAVQYPDLTPTFCRAVCHPSNLEISMSEDCGLSWW